MKNSVIYRRTAVLGLIAVGTLSLGSLGSLCPLLGGNTSGTTTGTPVSTLPTIGPTNAPTVPPTSAPATATPAPAPTLTGITPAAQNQGLAIDIAGTNLAGATELKFTSNMFVGVTSPVVIKTGFVVASGGTNITMLVPNLGTARATDVLVTVTTPGGFATTVTPFTYNP